MSAAADVDELIERYQLGLGEFMKGTPEPAKELFSHSEDVTLANPLGPPARGWDEVGATIEHAASQFRDGRFVSVEIVEKHVTSEFAYTLWLEHAGQGKRKGGRRSGHPQGHDDLSSGGRHLEGGTPPRRPHNHPTSARVGDTRVARPRGTSRDSIERLPEKHIRDLIPTKGAAHR